MKKISSNKFGKLKNKLDYKNYHLTETLEMQDKKLVVKEWKLFRRFNDEPEIYMSKYNKALLTSEKNTYRELKKFVNKHRRTDLSFVSCEASIIYVIVIWILCFINFFILKDSETRLYINFMIMGIIIGELIEFAVSMIATERDWKETQEKLGHKIKIHSLIIDDMLEKKKKNKD